MKPGQTRWLVLTAAVFLAWPGREQAWTAIILPAISPFIVVNSAIAARSADLLLLAALPLLVWAFFRPRPICRHLCPTGLMQDCVARRGPIKDSWMSRLPPLGKWAVLATFGGALCGFPLFLWLDPLALFNAFINSWRSNTGFVAVASGLGLPLLLLLAWWRPKIWCQRLCPLGAVQELAWRSPSEVAPRTFSLLPARPPALRRAGRPAGGYRRPVGRQRSVAEKGDEDESDAPAEKMPPGHGSRRDFLAAGAGACAALAPLRGLSSRGAPLRPPGSLPETSFAGVCVRCGNCAAVCPSRIIRSSLDWRQPEGLLAPTLDFSFDYCREDCHRCNTVCPSGAIARLSREEKRRRLIGLAHVDTSLCLLAQGRECTACIQKCPYAALAIHSADGGFSNEPLVDPAKCNGCGACETVCPVGPLRAIRVISRG